jgi:hypothetical protein
MSGWAPHQSFYDGVNRHREDEVPPPPTCMITRVDNGYIVTMPRQNSSGSNVVVCEDSTDGSGKVGSLMDALHEIIFALDGSGNTYDEHRIGIACKCGENHS